MADLRTYISNRPYFLALLPLFFVLHAGLENHRLNPFLPALEVYIIYSIVAFFLTAGAWIFFRNLSKAALLTFIILFINFFFGSFHDFVKSAWPGSFFSGYSFLLPLACILVLFATMLLKRSTKNFRGISKFLNLLFLILILIDVAGVFMISPADRVTVNNIQFNHDIPESKPDIYLVIADEYAGKKQLNDIFGFDNSEFEQQLRNRNFHVAEDPSSNYNSTMYSMASLLNMNYLENLSRLQENHADMYDCGQLVKNNALTRFFMDNGYDIFNHSIFDVQGEEKLAEVKFFPSKKQMILSQTLVERFKRDLGYHFISDEKLERSKKMIRENNEQVINKTIQTAQQRSSNPKFVYSHLILPHFPYYFDSNAREVPPQVMEEENKLNQADYLSYLKYTNKKLLKLVDDIIEHASSPPIILLMSDHGFRQFKTVLNKEYYFMNLNAVLLPGRNYQEFYPGISNVNQFRIVLNAAFNQQLSLLKDSSIFIWEEN